MSDSDVETPPMKSRKVSMANHATVARTTKSDSKKQRISNARKTRYSTENNDSLAQARQAKLSKQQSQKQLKQSRRSGTKNGNNHYQRVCNLQKLLEQINCKLQEYAQLDEIDNKIMYVKIFNNM